MSKNKTLVTVLALLVLTGTWIYSSWTAGEDVTPYLQKILPEGKSFSKIGSNPPLFKAIDQNDQELYVGFAEANGYGGPLMVGVVVNPDGSIRSTEVVEHKETPVYLGRVIQKKFLEQFKQKNTADMLVLGEDIDNVSGATLSSRAITDSIRQVSHDLARRVLNQTVQEKPESWKFGLPEIVITVMYMVALTLSFVWKRPRARMATIVVAIAVLGFWLNRPISLTYLSGMLLGFFPSLHQNIIWYIILFGALVPALLGGKNIYCYWLCPFGGVQELTILVSGQAKHRVPDRRLKQVRFVLLWVGLGLAFLYRNPGLANYEPFSTLFGINGTWVGWLLLFIILVASMFIYRFWCDVFCPVGAVMEICCKLRRRVANLFRPTKRQSGRSAGTKETCVES